MGKAKGGRAKVSNFARASHLHTFQSGRSVRVHDSVSYMWVMGQMARRQDETEAALAALAGGVDPLDGSPSALDALRMQDAIVQEVVKEPRVLIPEVDEPGDPEMYGSAWCWINDFTDGELTELMEMVAGEVHQAAGFPGFGRADAGREDGEVLGDDTVTDLGVAGGVDDGGDG